MHVDEEIVFILGTSVQNGDFIFEAKILMQHFFYVNRLWFISKMSTKKKPKITSWVRLNLYILTKAFVKFCIYCKSVCLLMCNKAELYYTYHLLCNLCDLFLNCLKLKLNWHVAFPHSLFHRGYFTWFSMF